MISVVIPLYNKEEMITKTVMSVLNQTFKEFEIIIVNDGSTDLSLDVVSGIADSRVKVVSIVNSGVSVARNTGIKLASYPWVALLDGDDWWAPNFLETMVTSISNYPKHKLFATGRSRVFKYVVERYDHELLPDEGSAAALNYFKVISRFLPLINSSNVVIRKTLFETAGYFRHGQRKHEDHDLWLRLAVGNEVVFVNKNLSFYRKTETNTASLTPFTATDFILYMKTMIEVKAQITPEEQTNFRHYYRKYVLLVYLQYYGGYTVAENKQVYAQLRELLSGKDLFLAKSIHALPLKWCYSLLRKIKGR